MNKIIIYFLFVSINAFSSSIYEKARVGLTSEVIAQIGESQEMLKQVEPITGDNLLHIAVQTANIKLTKFLMGKGLEEQKNFQGFLPIDYDIAGLLEHGENSLAAYSSEQSRPHGQDNDISFKMEDLPEPTLILLMRKIGQNTLIALCLVSKKLNKIMYGNSWPVSGDYDDNQSAFIAFFPTKLSHFGFDNGTIDQHMITKSADIQPKSRFVIANEENPIKLIDALGDGKIPAESYWAVGFDRGFIGAALTKAKHLFLMDYDLYVVKISRINVGLLAISKNMADYRRLRIEAPISEWQRRSAEYLKEHYAQLPAQYVRYLPNEENWILWNRCRTGFAQGLHKENSNKFVGANYLFEPTLFEHVKMLADQGLIVAERINLGDTKSLSTLQKQIQDQKIDVGIFDISNAWWHQFLSKEKLSALLQFFVKIKNTTQNKSSFACLATENSDDVDTWEYACLEIPVDGFGDRKDPHERFYEIFPLKEKQH